MTVSEDEEDSQGRLTVSGGIPEKAPRNVSKKEKHRHTHAAHSCIYGHHSQQKVQTAPREKAQRQSPTPLELGRYLTVGFYMGGHVCEGAQCPVTALADPTGFSGFNRIFLKDNIQRAALKNLDRVGERPDGSKREVWGEEEEQWNIGSL